jgi:hypothetical protein
MGLHWNFLQGALFDLHTIALSFQKGMGNWRLWWRAKGHLRTWTPTSFHTQGRETCQSCPGGNKTCLQIGTTKHVREECSECSSTNPVLLPKASCFPFVKLSTTAQPVSWLHLKASECPAGRSSSTAQVLVSLSTQAKTSSSNRTISFFPLHLKNTWHV